MESAWSRSPFQAAYSGVSNSLLRSRGFISSVQLSMPIRVGSAAGKYRTVRRSRDLAQIAHQLDVGRKVAEMVIGDQATIRLAAKLPELLLVQLLEQRALVPARSRIQSQIAVQLVLGNVHHPDLELCIGLRIEDEMMQAAPGAFDLLEGFGACRISLTCAVNFLIEPRDHLLDRVEHMVFNDARVGERFADQRGHCILNLGGRALAARLEALLQERGKFIRIARLDDSALLPRCGSCRHK